MGVDWADWDFSEHRKRLESLRAAGLTTRASNSISNGVSCGRLPRIDCLEDFVHVTAHDLLGLPEFGRKSLNDVEQLLAIKGLKLIGAAVPPVIFLANGG